VALAALSGLLLSLAFPNWLTSGLHPWTGWLAWVALVPLLIAIESATPREGAVAGWCGGTVFFGSTLYWVMAIRELAFARVPALAALAVVFGLYWMAWGWLMAHAGHGRTVWLAAPAWWLLETVRGSLGTGFPWTTLGATQWALPAVFLSARFIGVAGVGTGLKAVNVAVWAVLRRHTDRPLACRIAGGWMLVLLGGSLLATHGIRAAADTAHPIRVAALQGSFSEEDKWSLPVSVLLRRYEDLSAEAARHGATLLVWPETATASEIEAPGMVAALTKLAARTHATHVVGALSVDATGRDANGAFVVTAAGLGGGYRKMHLVPFGEYIPGWARTVFPFIRKLTEGMVDLVPGRDPAPLDVPGIPHLRLGVFVCYEAVFSGMGRALAAQCPTLLVNVTNDAWYHDSAATCQHALGPMARAVETGRWVVRAANTGLSFVVAPDATLTMGPGLSEPGLVIADVIPPRDACERTPWVRWGEAPLAAYALVALLAAWRRSGA
jgi:apolipoprotein N-acyltransferase